VILDDISIKSAPAKGTVGVLEEATGTAARPNSSHTNPSKARLGEGRLLA
jgi:hypothetical protein